MVLALVAPGAVVGWPTWRALTTEELVVRGSVENSRRAGYTARQAVPRPKLAEHSVRMKSR
mgnify:CR=1 FL=1